MDVSKILTELRQEREQIEEAIMSLERLASGADGAAAARRVGWPGWKKSADALQAAKINFRTLRRQSDSLNPAGPAAFQR